MTTPYLSPISRKTSGHTLELNTIEPNLEHAGVLVQQLRARLDEHRNKQLFNAFTALAEGDQAVGLLAFYLWRRKNRRHT